MKSEKSVHDETRMFLEMFTDPRTGAKGLVCVLCENVKVRFMRTVVHNVIFV